jgi:hypothetical protein
VRTEQQHYAERDGAGDGLARATEAAPALQF